jgi:class 3 adenylate cyclase/tetratricopeptide (TPR) repeat protein
LTLRLGPERVKRVLGEAFAGIRTLILEQGGTIEKYVGDTIFAIFGAPVAHADDQERALRAANACAGWVAQREPPALPLAVRVGVETGQALVDLDAVDGERQQMVVGNCVNVASRLQQQAQPGEVLVGPDCHDATADIAEFEGLGPYELKGIGSMQVWKLVRVAAGVRQGPLLPFFGRLEELTQLRSAYARARSGRATLVLVIGPPGQGKTRLAQELVEQVRGEANILQARCRPGGETGTFTPLKQLLAGDLPDATAEEVTARVQMLLHEPEENSPVASALCHCAGLRVDQRLLGLRPVEREQELASAWRRYLTALGEERPLLVWIEDVHWAEPQLVRLLDRLALGAGMRLLLMATGRPEFVGAAVLRPGEDRIFFELGRLDAESARALARSAGAQDERTIERAQGHPLFIIELARTRTRLMDLPITVQAAIAARLDELPPFERDLLQRAAVVGDTFTIGDAALLTARHPAEVAGSLARLAHLRYLYPVDHDYRFHHVLVRDVAYGRLSTEQRMRLHARYAQEGVPAEDAEALAHHLWEARRPPDAAWVWEAPEREALRREALQAHLAAGRRLSDRFELERALEVYDRAVALAEGNPLEIGEIETAVGFAYVGDARGDEAWEHRLRAIAAYRRAGSDPPATLYADMLQTPTRNFGYFRTVPAEEIVLQLLEEGQAVARKTNDSLSLGRLLVQRAEFVGSDPLTAADIVQLVENSPETVQHAQILQHAAQVLYLAGEISQAVAAFNRMNRLVSMGGKIDEHEALMWNAALAFYAGDLVRADAFADQLLDASMMMNAHIRQHAKATKALVLLGRGNWSALAGIVRDTESLVVGHPNVGFCLIGAAAFAYGAIADLLAGKRLPDSLATLVERCVPESPGVRASTLLLPYAMSGRFAELHSVAVQSWRSPQRVWDRQIWDPFSFGLAIARTVLEQWGELKESLRHLDDVAGKGGGLCAALAEGIRAEMTAARGKRSPQHAELDRLRYYGLSELLSYRPKVAA